VQGSEAPVIKDPAVVVFAGDHGIALTGLVNPYPQAVTAQMVLNFLNEGAAINVFCRMNNLKLVVVDSGVNHEFTEEQQRKLFNAKVSRGTANYLEGPAMDRDAVRYCIEKGREVIQGLYERGTNLVAFGEMGISNTSSASLIMSVLMNRAIEECVGAGTGVEGEQWLIKCKTLRQVFELRGLANAKDVYELMSAVGGFEIVMMAGAFLEAAKKDMVIVVDGFITTAALRLALEMDKNVLANCLFAHCSGEKGHAAMLEYLGVKPLLNLGLRLGEGTGAALAIPIIQAAVKFLNEMASFSSAGISNRI
jgi:nicotinate-nucleotide--dimethylbenzimidazole phosphoribosyltransferase